MTGPAGDPRIDEVPVWYHTLDLGQGRVTPGWFDLRGVVDRFPWPDVAGKRCLDIGTYDGFLAFELERRGAAEVVATDVPDHADWDWLPREARDGAAQLAAVAGRKGRGFEVARELLGSGVRREWCNVYDLSPERLGTFDVVVCGALLLHLRDPLRALAAIRSVTTGELVSIEQVDVATTVSHPRRPVTFVRGRRGQWQIPNAAAHRRWVTVAGFDVVAATRLAEPFGPSHPDPAPRSGPAGARAVAADARQRLAFGGPGIPVQAVRAVPSPDAD